MIEWDDKWNPFNGMKALVHVKHFDDCLHGKAKPRFISIDPSLRCNLRCPWCNSKDVLGSTDMTVDDMQRVLELVERWHVKAVCIGGGGEPTMNHKLIWLIRSLYSRGVQIGMITNGICIRRHKDILPMLKWIGVSIDAADRVSYAREKGIDRWDELMSSLRCIKEAPILKEGKMLITECNHTQIYEFCRLMRVMGMDLAHIRPGATLHPAFLYSPQMVEEIGRQVDRARRELETDTYKIYAVTHKFGADLSQKNDFVRCYAGLATCCITADGWVDLCVCQRGKYRLCKIEDVHERWGDIEHHRLLESIDPSRCPACTYKHINDVYQNVVLNDRMGYEFM